MTTEAAEGPEQPALRAERRGQHPQAEAVEAASVTAVKEYAHEEPAEYYRQFNHSTGTAVVRNRMPGGVGGRREQSRLLPDQVSPTPFSVRNPATPGAERAGVIEMQIRHMWWGLFNRTAPHRISMVMLVRKKIPSIALSGACLPVTVRYWRDVLAETGGPAP